MQSLSRFVLPASHTTDEAIRETARISTAAMTEWAARTSGGLRQNVDGSAARSAARTRAAWPG